MSAGAQASLPLQRTNVQASQAQSRIQGGAFTRQIQVLMRPWEGMERTRGVEQRGRMDEEVVGRIAPRERAHQDEKSGPQLSSQRTRKSACGGGIVQGLSLHYPRKLRAGVRGGGGQGGLREAIP